MSSTKKQPYFLKAKSGWSIPSPIFPIKTFQRDFGRIPIYGLYSFGSPFHFYGSGKSWNCFWGLSSQRPLIVRLGGKYFTKLTGWLPINWIFFPSIYTYILGDTMDFHRLNLINIFSAHISSGQRTCISISLHPPHGKFKFTVGLYIS